MKFYVLLTVATVVIISSYFFIKHQEAQKAEANQIAAAEQMKIQKQMSDAQARMEESARLAEQEDALLASKDQQTAGVSRGAGASGLLLRVDQLGSGTKLNGSKRVKVVFEGKGPSKHGVRKTYDHMDDSYIAGEGDDEDGFKYSSAKYSHPTERAERVGRASNEMSDDLLIVEGRLEDRVQRARQ